MLRLVFLPASILDVLALSSLDVFFTSRHRDSVWRDSLRGSSTIVRNIRVLVVFGDSAMPRGLPKESPFLNHPGQLLAHSRHHGEHRYRPPLHHHHSGAAAAAAAVGAAGSAVAANVGDDRCDKHVLSFMMALFLVHHVSKRGLFITCMKVFQAAFSATATSEGLDRAFIPRHPFFLLLVELSDTGSPVPIPRFVIPTILVGRHGKLFGLRTVGPPPQRPRSGHVPRFFAAVVRDLGFPPSLVVTTWKVPAVEASQCPPLVHWAINLVVVLVLVPMVFGCHRYLWDPTATPRVASREMPTCAC